eukprot:4629278-Amphidinium_carterae.1
MAENEKLDLNFREEEEKNRGAIEERGDFKMAKQLRDIDAAQHIIYEYAQGVRERRAQWREEKIKEDDKKKQAWLAQEREEAAAASTSETSTVRTGERKATPPRPIRPVPAPPSQQQIPATPSQLPEVPGLSPRLRLQTENFKNTQGQTDDSYYAKKIFDEIRQRSYITQHPTSQYYNISPEIKRIYDGFMTEDY